MLKLVHPDNESDSKKRVTLDDLAKAVGISRSAASKAMRDHPRIGEKTRKKVQKLAVELGYTRDPALSRLAKYRWSANSPGGGEPIAFLYPYDSKHGHDPTFREACEKVATANGFVFHAIYAGDYKPAHLRKVLQARGVRGVIFQRIVDAELVDELLNAYFVCVAVDEGTVLAPCEMIRSDYLWCITEAIRRHQEAGRENLILLLRNGMRSTAFADRMKAVWEHEGLKREDIIVHNAFQPEELPNQLNDRLPNGIVSFLWTRLPEGFTKNLKDGHCPQYAMRLFKRELEVGAGFYLSEERIAYRAIHYLETHLIQAGRDKHFGTTLMRPEWIAPGVEPQGTTSLV